MARRTLPKWALLSFAVVSFGALSACTTAENRQMSEAAAVSDLSRPNDPLGDGIVEDAGRSPGAQSGAGQPL